LYNEKCGAAHLLERENRKGERRGRREGVNKRGRRRRGEKGRGWKN